MDARRYRPGYWLLGAAVAVAMSSSAMAHGNSSKKPITLEKTGGFVIGGKVISNPANPARTLSCDHGYVEYFIPTKSRKTSLVMWHSSHTQVWQNRWDGGEGYKDMFLRRNYPVYIWDGPRVGRANWACDTVTYTPGNRDQGNFTAWKFGPVAPAGTVPTASEWYPGVKFPTTNTQAWLDATRSFWVELGPEELGGVYVTPEAITFKLIDRFAPDAISRVTFSNISADHFTWREEKSLDHGRTWSECVAIEAHRVD